MTCHHAQEVRRLFIDRLTAAELDQSSSVATTILDGLREDQPADPPAQPRHDK